MTNVNPPHTYFNAMQRRQAVVWLAQDVYASDLGKLKTLDDQTRLIMLWKDILVRLKDNEGLVKMNELLLKALGHVARNEDSRF